MRVRREVLGDAEVDASIARTTPFNAAFFDHVTSSVWGQVWGREISEVLLHSAAYAGVPNARGAMLVAERVLAELVESDG
jgi:4-carboxymuconolactone decarboxylase